MRYFIQIGITLPKTLRRRRLNDGALIPVFGEHTHILRLNGAFADSIVIKRLALKLQSHLVIDKLPAVVGRDALPAQIVGDAQLLARVTQRQAVAHRHIAAVNLQSFRHCGLVVSCDPRAIRAVGTRRRRSRWTRRAHPTCGRLARSTSETPRARKPPRSLATGDGKERKR